MFELWACIKACSGLVLFILGVMLLFRGIEIVEEGDGFLGTVVVVFAPALMGSGVCLMGASLNSIKL